MVIFLLAVEQEGLGEDGVSYDGEDVHVVGSDSDSKKTICNEEEEDVSREEGEELARELGVRFLVCGGGGKEKGKRVYECIEEMVRFVVVQGRGSLDDGSEDVDEKVDETEEKGRRSWWGKLSRSCGGGE